MQGDLEQLGISVIVPIIPSEDQPNGETLYRLLSTGSLPQATLDAFVNLYAGAKERAICSSENFTKFGQAEWQLISDSCRRQNIRAKIIVFVRDVAPYYFSLHGQLMKSGEERSDFAQFCEIDRYSSVRQSLESMFGVIGRERMHVIRYDPSGCKLGEKFMFCLGVETGSLDFSSLAEKINRSLTCYERDIVSRINNAIGRQYGFELCELLEKKFPDLRSDYVIDPDIVRSLADRHQTDLDWINATFFEGAQEIRLNGADDSDLPYPKISSDTQLEIDQEIISWCANKLMQSQRDTLTYLANLCRSIDYSKRDDEHIPQDFDPVAYLVQNIDLVSDGVCPFDHFRTHGRHELARKWSWHETK